MLNYETSIRFLPRLDRVMKLCKTVSTYVTDIIVTRTVTAVPFILEMLTCIL